MMLYQKPMVMVMITMIVMVMWKQWLITRWRAGSLLYRELHSLLWESDQQSWETVVFPYLKSFFKFWNMKSKRDVGYSWMQRTDSVKIERAGILPILLRSTTYMDLLTVWSVSIMIKSIWWEFSFVNFANRQLGARQWERSDISQADKRLKQLLPPPCGWGGKKERKNLGQ